ncbi:MAG: biotin--[acetyl-CoA-carboxylase] ligase [Bacteroidales bacterium]
MEFNIRRFDTTGSTNSIALENIKVDRHFTVYWARFQERGRGQRGKGWESEKDKNLLFSILLKEIDIKAKEQFQISQTISLAIVDYLSKRGMKAKIKWPNDIYIEDKKICGILIEHYLMGDILSASIVGIGLNVNQRLFLSGAPNPISLTELTGVEHSLEEELHLLLSVIYERFETFYWGERERAVTALGREYKGYLYRVGEFALYQNANSSTAEAVGEPFEAKIVGVTDIGELILKRRNGHSATYSFKEVRYIIDSSDSSLQ